MKFVIVTVNEVLFNNPCVFEFYRAHKDRVAGVVECRGFFSFKRLVASGLILGLSGARRILKKFAAAKNISMRDFCRQENIPYLKTGDINGEEVVAFCRERGPDFLVSINTPRKIKRELLSRYQGINLHFADLPKYRGLFPVFWALKNHEPRIGVSVNLISETIDTGTVIARDFIPSRDSDFLSVLEKCFQAAPKTLSRALDYFDPGKKTDFLLPEKTAGKGSYYSVPSMADILSYRRSRRPPEAQS